jgi:type VI secretion system secreted protein VgrG
LLDQAGKPVPGEQYSIELPDGSTTEGTLDSQGRARVDGLDPGNCKISFPNIDKKSWRKK